MKGVCSFLFHSHFCLSCFIMIDYSEPMINQQTHFFLLFVFVGKIEVKILTRKNAEEAGDQWLTEEDTKSFRELLINLLVILEMNVTTFGFISVELVHTMRFRSSRVLYSRLLPLCPFNTLFALLSKQIPCYYCSTSYSSGPHGRPHYTVSTLCNLNRRIRLIPHIQNFTSHITRFIIIEYTI